MFLLADATLSQVIHMICAWSAWEWSTHDRLSREPAVRIASVFRCICSAPRRSFHRRFPWCWSCCRRGGAVLALVGIANGSVGGNGDGDSYLLPHPSDSSAILQDRKRLLLPGERTRHFSFLSLRRMSVRAPRLCPLCRPSMRSCWR